MSLRTEIVAELEEFADILDAQDVSYKPTAYRRAADSIREYPGSIGELADNGPDAVKEIKNVGDAIASKVVEYVETGEIEELEDEREQFPVNMAELTAVEGVGPKTVGKLYTELDVQTLDDLEEAATEENIRDVSGFGAKTEQNIRNHIEFARQSQKRERLGDAVPIASGILDRIRALAAVERAETAGSLRRWRDTIGDVDVLVATDSGEAVGEALGSGERVEEVLDSGPTKTSVRADGQRIDLRAVSPEEFGAALQYFTGSKAHNIRLRNHAIEQEKKVNEYGVFDVSEIADSDSGQRVGERVASETEEEMYTALGLPLIAPELREDRGEIEAAVNDELPDLLETEDIRGDLHTHTEWSDGASSIAKLAEGAVTFGHDYICITDHAAGPGIISSSGLTADDLREQAEEIQRVREDPDVPNEGTEITMFHGVEANIDADGNIERVDDEVLADLDLVIASPHSGLGDDGGDQTERLIRAVEHPHVDVLGHPSGRLINDRPAMEFDPDRVGTAAADAGTALEVNANPHRLDLWGGAVKAAIDAGVLIVINTDAHSSTDFSNVKFGVHTARRGWAEPADVLNTRDANGVREFLD